MVMTIKINKCAQMLVIPCRDVRLGIQLHLHLLPLMDDILRELLAALVALLEALRHVLTRKGHRKAT